MLIAGTSFFIGIPICKPTGVESIIAVAMLLVAVVFLQWPHRCAPLLIATGLILGILPIPRRWPKAAARATVGAGAVLLIQSLAMLLYESMTARSHELPLPLARLLLRITQLLGAEVALDGTTLTMRTAKAVHRLGATWELLLDPVTLCFLIGGIILFCLVRSTCQASERETWPWVTSTGALILSVTLWLPVRAAIMIGLYLHRDFRTAYNEPLILMNQFWQPWLHLALLSGPVLLALQLVRMPTAIEVAIPLKQRQRLFRRMIVGTLAVVGVFTLTLAWVCDPPGRRKAGRVLVDEHHSEWEPTERPYDPNWYGHEAGYTYACIYDYCSRFYEMSRLETPVDVNALQDCDVLMIKVPTSRYKPDEIATIARFVENGGGILLIGDHTNVFKSGTCLNDIAKRFGFSFCYDCLWDVDTVGDQLYRLPTVPHPIIQKMPLLNFAVGCSIDPGVSRGRAVIRSRGLTSMPADYHLGNFMARPEDSAEMRYGAFIQLWAARHGDGRVAAFTDSTIFSNFATFEPGKAELMLGMLEWLNHRNSAHDPRAWLCVLGIILIASGLVVRSNLHASWVLMLAAGTFGWTCAVLTAQTIHRFSMPLPGAARPLVKVAIDRTVCDAPLSKSGVIMGEANGFGIFERWILRLGYFTSRQHGRKVFQSDLVVLLHPNGTIEDVFRRDMVEFVEAGGKVLILDSPENVRSTANSLLYPFGLALERSTRLSGSLKTPEGWPSVHVTSACRVSGGEPLTWLDNMPVASRVQHGKGTVTVIGFGGRFTDANMGHTGEVVPDADLRKVFDLEFAMLKHIVSE